jgi:signal peptidase I
VTSEKETEGKKSGQLVSRPRKGLVRELTEGLLTAFVIAAVLKIFIIQAFRIPS